MFWLTVESFSLYNMKEQCLISITFSQSLKGTFKNDFFVESKNQNTYLFNVLWEIKRKTANLHLWKAGIRKNIAFMLELNNLKKGQFTPKSKLSHEHLTCSAMYASSLQYNGGEVNGSDV